MDKKNVIQSLETIATYMEIAGENPFKISAYRKAAAALEREERTLLEIEKPESLTGIGKGTASVIEQLRDTGKSDVLDELKESIPAGLPPLLQLQSLGGKKVGKLYKELGITDADTLKEACEKQQIRELQGFGVKTEEKILQALNEVGKRPERLPVSDMLSVAEEIEEQLRAFTHILRFERAGSLRRIKETVKDVDYVISTSDAQSVREQLKTLTDIEEIVADGDTKVSFVLLKKHRIGVDFRLVEDEAFATALHHFTGSKDHHLLMRKLAKDQGKKINEYGVEQDADGSLVQFKDERQFFEHFGLTYIPPEAREGSGEIERSRHDHPYIQLEDIQSDLHMHTVWSDGANSVKEMADDAKKRGYNYICITDHSKFLQVANGLNEERLARQAEDIDDANEHVSGIRVLKGTEMDIRPDGTLDFDNDVLQTLDFVIASIHSSFSQSKEQIHERLETAFRNPFVHMIAHPTGRIIGQRSGYEVDIDWLIARAKETGTALELNANPNRLDLSAEQLKKVVTSGVVIAVNTDAHRQEMMDHMKIGVATLNKAFVQKEQVMNTWTYEQFKQFTDNKRTLFE
ncbi:DNA polymerase X family [Geomicrobium sp. JCM 19037]|uniref:DNA polymerase/3'-5' exonuclease PolX n=1 Tax=unclassified Geomicrobium TaxID=2628951 RepID=UPI00045F1392|nr:DNA polymerase/3'-5' exonuclease PolX [Geomicrobium sp. JCM 19037]GAK05167.1 DNA polymerase X family [Geomicrobium sp. JCM 19037]